jgi:hypothetical protein
MALAATTVLQGQNIFIATLAAGADGDTTVDVAHGLGVTPLVYFIMPTAQATSAANNCFYNITAPTATKVTVNKAGGVGSAALSAALLVVMRPHSIIE